MAQKGAGGDLGAVWTELYRLQENVSNLTLQLQGCRQQVQDAAEMVSKVLIAMKRN